jgi:type II secretion system protein G
VRLAAEVLSTFGMIACAVHLLLLVVVTPVQDSNRVRCRAARLQIEAFMESLEQFASDCGHYPSSAAGLAALRQAIDCAGWRGPYLSRRIPPDPWGTPYTYSLPGRHARPLIISFGADKQAGGEFFNSDIASSTPGLVVPEGPTDIRFSGWVVLAITFFGFIAFLWASLRLWGAKAR